VQLLHAEGVIILNPPGSRRYIFRFGSRRALERFVERVTGRPDGEAIDVAWQFVQEGRAEFAGER
jgi:hypothetical protein